MASTTTYSVSGMTCAHCVAAVTEEISLLSGVERVHVDLVAGGESTVAVTSVTPLTKEAVRAAVDEAGYTLIGASG